MQWTDDGLVLACRRHGETGVILELMTMEHGRHLGLVHGGRSRRMQPVLQTGNSVRATWRARLDEALGSYAVEPLESAAARLFGSGLALYGLGHLGALLRCLPERDPHPRLYEAARVLVEHLDDHRVAPALMVRFELALLSELGFGLDLTTCAATGSTGGNDALIYVSPRSGRAVSASAGEPYRDRLLPLPAFLRDRARAPSDEVDAGSSPEGAAKQDAGAGHGSSTLEERDVAQGFTLTGYFLRQHIWEPRALAAPEERARFIALGTSPER